MQIGTQFNPNDLYKIYIVQNLQIKGKDYIIVADQNGNILHKNDLSTLVDELSLSYATLTDELLKEIDYHEPECNDLKKVSPKNGFIYFIESETGLTKIGYTKNVSLREKALQSASPVPLTVRYSKYVKDAVEVEKTIHNMFEKDRVRNEWFSLSDNQIDEAIKHMEVYDDQAQKNIHSQ